MGTLASIFKRDDIRGFWPEELNSQVAVTLGQALCELLQQRKLPVNLVLGHDARKGSYDLSLAFLRGFTEKGGKADFLGLVSSEQLYYACGRYGDRYAAGVMVTASHNPKEYNGMKFIHGGGLPFSKEDLSALKDALLAKLPPAPEVVAIGDEFADYLLALAGFQGQPGERPAVKAVVAAGNGVGGVAFDPLAKRLNAWGFQFVFLDKEPNGDFPNGVPNPLMPEQIQRLGEAVIAQQADLGIVFDGDADRAGFVDCEGKEIIPSQVYAIVAEQKRTQGGRDNPVVMRNLCCSQLLADLFGKADSGVELIDTPVGHGQIKQLMRHPEFKDRILFAGEHSGHYFYPEFFSVDSGFLTALYMLTETQRLKGEGTSLPVKLNAWREQYRWSGELNYLLPDRAAVNAVLAKLDEVFGSRENVKRYGIAMDPSLKLFRVFELTEAYCPAQRDFPDIKFQYQDPNSAASWWFVVRPSGNESKLRLNFESRQMVKGEEEAVFNEIQSVLAQFHAEKA